MNRFYLLWTCLVWLAVSAACSHREVPDESYEAARLFVTTEGLGGVPTRVLPEEEGTAGERTYGSLHIYYYKAATGELVRYQKVTTGAGELYPHVVNVPIEVYSAGAVEVYVLASPVDGEPLPATPTVAELKTLLTAGMRDGSTVVYTDRRFIPMSGKLAAPHDFYRQNVAEIKLRRTVAKLRIRLDDREATNAGTTLHTDDMMMQLRNVRTQIPYLPLPADTYTPTGITVFDSQTFGKGGTPFVPETTGGTTVWQHTAYVAEHLFDDTTLPLPDNRAVLFFNLPYTANGILEAINRYTLPLNFELKRNHIYQITLKISGPGEGGELVNVEVHVEIIPWNTIDLDVIE